MPKVSIIIPVFNKERYLAATLDSVLEQNFSDYEVVVVNDGSTDESPEIIKSYEEKDSRIRSIHIPNGGVSHARNVGLAAAKGEWIQFLDGDDLIDREYLAKGVPLTEGQDAEILFSNFQMIDENGNRIKEIVCTYQGKADQRKLCQQFMTDQYTNGFFGYISNKLIRRSVLESSNASFPEQITLAEDLDFYAKVYPKVQKAFFADINSFSYLQTETNYLNSDRIDYYSQLIVRMDIRSWFLESGFYEQYQQVLDKQITEYVFFSLFHARENQQNEQEIYKKITEDQETMSCIHPEYLEGYARWITVAVKKKQEGVVMLLFNVRRMIRNVYRRVQNG
ncbi:MAG: glycosyltransferase family 2 protein [Fusicatenibacter sp.]|nr:glycosyltransferase family 2 protein [Lachnospiraceae bacterium]MDY2938247.1 glycosyltransferase family 2 protein [Fusicatenibacter sp.]